MESDYLLIIKKFKFKKLIKFKLKIIGFELAEIHKEEFLGRKHCIKILMIGNKNNQLFNKLLTNKIKKNLKKLLI